VIEPTRTSTEEEMIAGENIPRRTRRFQTRIVGGRWHQLASLPGSVTAATPTWSYLRDIDQSWGCGSSEKVVAVRGGQPFEIAGDLRSQDFHVSLARTMTSRSSDLARSSAASPASAWRKSPTCRSTTPSSSRSMPAARP